MPSSEALAPETTDVLKAILLDCRTGQARLKGVLPEGTPVALHAVLALARLGDPQAAELLGTANALARAEDAAVVARIEAILKDPKLADEDRTTSGAATLVRKP